MHNTSMGMIDGFNYDRSPFTPAEPFPESYVVAYGYAHFRGPDGKLWFAPPLDAGGDFDWEVAQNVAEFDARFASERAAMDPALADGYEEIMAQVCRLVDAAVQVTEAYTADTAHSPRFEKPAE